MWVDENKTLWEERNRDLWQLPILSQDGEYLGNVIGQIVEPNRYLVRYLVSFFFRLGSGSVSWYPVKLC